MVFLTAALFSPSALAGYGDVEDSYPSWEEREMHLVTNMVRVAPEAFEADYASGGCSLADFQSSEQTPKDPLYYSRPLNEAARFHSDDMWANDWFAHDSSDGTDWAERLSRFYSEGSGLGENIAYGYSDSYDVVLRGWMCSSGHRANIMNGSFVELGTGVVSSYYTQDFSSGAGDSVENIRMGVHAPRDAGPGDAITLTADYEGAPPAIVSAVLGDAVWPMELALGDSDRGVYEVALTAPDAGCLDYYFVYEDDQGARGVLPATGAYRFGPDCDTAEGDADWQLRATTRSPWGDADPDDPGPGGFDDDPGDPTDDLGGADTMDVEISGCSSAGGGGGGSLAWLGLFGLAALGARRRAV